MPNRRTVLAALAASAVNLPLAARAEGFAPAPTVLRYGDFYVVDSWVLTKGDLDRLGVHAR